MYSILYQLGLKLYANVYGRRLLLLLISIPLGISFLLSTEYFLSTTIYSTSGEAFVSLLTSLGIAIKLTPALDMGIYTLPILVAGICYLIFLRKLTTHKIKYRSLSYDTSTKELILEVRNGTKLFIPMSFITTTVLFSLTYMLFIEFSIYHWILFKGQLGDHFQSPIIVLAILSLIEFVVVSYETIDLAKRLAVYSLCHSEEEMTSVITVFETVIKDDKAILHYLDIDHQIKHFIELDIFQSPFKINFKSSPNEYYRIEINNTLVAIYKEIRTKNKQ